MKQAQFIARSVSLLFVILAMTTTALAQTDPAPPKPSQVQYILLTPAEFAEKAADLIDKDVEVGGDIEVPHMMSRKSVGTMVDKDSGKVLVQLVAKPGSRALEWLAGGDRQTKSRGVFARGKVVMVADYQTPVLELTDISRESKVQAAADLKARTEAIAAKDKDGLVKEVLPPHTNPSGEAAKAWLDRIPPTSPGFDRAKTIWENMCARADQQRQFAADDDRAIIRGPDRPANFETYYRGVRDTGLRDLFAKSPYQNMTTTWPRVMIVIEEKPKGGTGIPSEYWHQGTKTKSDYTWRFHATVWTDATHSVDIAPFNWCFSEMRCNTAYMEVPIWGHAPKQNVPAPRGVHAASAAQPAVVPVPPKYPLPDNFEYNRHFSFNSIMVGNVLLDMGFHCNRPDGRVWFVEDIAKEKE